MLWKTQKLPHNKLHSNKSASATLTESLQKSEHSFISRSFSNGYPERPTPENISPKGNNRRKAEKSDASNLSWRTNCASPFRAVSVLLFADGFRVSIPNPRASFSLLLPPSPLARRSELPSTSSSKRSRRGSLWRYRARASGGYLV